MLPKGPPQGKWAWPKRQGHHHNPSQERRHQQRAAGREMEAILKEQKTLEGQKADLQVRLQQQQKVQTSDGTRQQSKRTANSKTPPQSQKKKKCF